MRINYLLLAMAIVLLLPFSAKGATTIDLPKPNMDGGKSLMQALSERKSNRQIDKREVSLDTLSTLLWATWGVNRPDGRHTAPTAKNGQKIWVYLMRTDGVWEYQPAQHRLVQVMDRRIGLQFADAPVHLLYATPADDPYGKLHVGSLYQNAGLYCASAGLANVVKVSTVHEQGQFADFLPKGLVIHASQSIGWPKSGN